MASDDPDSQVADTIALMSRYVRQDAGTPEVRAAAEEAAPIGSTSMEAVEGVFEYVRRLIRFQQDDITATPLAQPLARKFGDLPVVEVLIRPRDMLSWRQDTGKAPVGDCDDYAMLTAALLRAKGIPAKFVTVAADPSVPCQFSHVYVAAYPKGEGRVALDTSHGEYAGWEAERVDRRQEWEIGAGLKELLLAGMIVWALCSQWWGRRKRRSS